MKIGAVIVSDFNHNNYGSALQAYATIKTVQKFGHDITLINLHISYSPVMRMNQRLFCRKYVESYEYLHFENQRCPSRC